MAAHGDNRMVIGYYPSSEFVNYGGKRMQNPPIQRNYEHPLDIYRTEELESFLTDIMPCFMQPLRNEQEYQEFLLPRYSPKLIFLTRDDTPPYVLHQLSVAYYMRFDVLLPHSDGLCLRPH